MRIYNKGNKIHPVRIWQKFITVILVVVFTITSASFVSAQSNISPPTIFPIIVKSDTVYSYGKHLTEEECIHLELSLANLKKAIGESDEQKKQANIQAAIVFLAYEFGLVSRKILDDIQDYDSNTLGRFYTLAVLLLGSVLEGSDSDIDHYKRLGQKLSEYGQGEHQAMMRTIVDRLGWRLILINGRPIFVTPEEVKSYEGSTKTERIKLFNLLPKGIIITKVEKETTRQEKPEAGAVPESGVEEQGEEGLRNTALMVLPQQTSGLPANRQSVFTSSVIRHRKEVQRDILDRGLARRIRARAKEKRFKEAADLLQKGHKRKEAQPILTEIFKNDPTPFDFELLRYVDTQLATDAFMHAFAYTDGKLDLDRVGKVMELFSTIQPEKIYQYNSYKQAEIDNLYLDEILPVSCFILSKMAGTKAYMPFMSRMREAADDIVLRDADPKVSNIAKLFEIVDELTLNGKTYDLTKTVKESTFIARELQKRLPRLRELESRLQPLEEHEGERPEDSLQEEYRQALQNLSDFCIAHHSPMNIIRVFMGCAELTQQQAFDLLIQLLRVQDWNTAAEFISILEEECSIPVLHRDVGALSMPGITLSIGTYNLGKEDQRTRFFAVMLSEIAEINMEFAVQVLDFLVKNPDSNLQESQRLVERIMLMPEPKLAEEIIAVHNELAKLDGYNLPIEFQITQTLLAKSLKGSKRRTAINRCAMIIKLTRENLDAVKDADLYVLLRVFGLEEAQKQAIDMLARLGAIEEIYLLIRLFKDGESALHDGKYSKEALNSLNKLAETHGDTFNWKHVQRLKELSEEADVLLTQIGDGLREVLIKLGHKGNKPFIAILLKDFDKYITDLMEHRIDYESDDFQYFRNLLGDCYKFETPEWSRLMYRLNISDRKRRRILVRVLEDIGISEDIIENITAVFRGNQREKIDAINYLGENRAICAIGPLKGCFKDNRMEVKEAVAGALGKIGGSAAVNAILQEMREGDWHIMKAYLMVYKKMRERAGVTILRGGSIAEGEMAWEGLILLNALIDAGSGTVGESDPTTIDSLVEALSDRDSDLRCVSAWALGELGDSSVLEVLRKRERIERDNEVRTAVTDAINKIESRQQVLDTDLPEIVKLSV